MVRERGWEGGGWRVEGGGWRAEGCISVFEYVVVGCGGGMRWLGACVLSAVLGAAHSRPPPPSVRVRLLSVRVREYVCVYTCRYGHVYAI